MILYGGVYGGVYRCSISPAVPRRSDMRYVSAQGTLIPCGGWVGKGDYFPNTGAFKLKANWEVC